MEAKPTPNFQLCLGIPQPPSFLTHLLALRKQPEVLAAILFYRQRFGKIAIPFYISIQHAD
jgi:hypothetical protein